MSLPGGRSVPLSRTRRLLCDFLHFARAVPTVVAERSMGLGPLILARKRLELRPCWYAIFLKAYGMVAREVPDLRRCYRSFPWPHLHEHGCNVGSVPICRQLGDEEGILFLQLRQPEQQGLDELHAQIEHARTAPPESIRSFREQLRIGRLPLPLRRLVWWVGLHGLMGLRLRHFGTFGLTGVAGRGSDTTVFLSPLTTNLTFGVFEPDGRVTLRLVYDHRVLDGELIGRALRRLEETLEGPILTELTALAGRQHSPHAA
jgi:hypothetical protein